MTSIRFKRIWRAAIVGAIITAIIISVGFNALVFWEKKKTELIAEGIDKALIAIVQQISTEGEARITFSEGVLILIQKPQVKTEDLEDKIK